MTIYLGSTFATYNYYANNNASAMKEASADPQISNATKYYEENIGKVKSVDDFVSNYRLFSYAMTAYGLSDMVYAKAMMTKVLNSDLSDSSSFANKLTDTRFTNFAKAFSELGSTTSSTDTTTSGDTTTGDTTDTTSTAATTAEVVSAYLEQSVEDSLGQTDQGVQLALYFKRTASTVSSAYGLLADSALWKVVQTVYGLPANLGSMELETQKSVVESKFDVADLQDPEKVEKLLKRFTVLWDATENAASDPILQLFGVGSSSSSSSGGGAEVLTLF
ncbi:DUF1217 domain-containing protein [Xanthobacter sp. V4C-4]|uniref:DUF1217 domain-containing protein n=1 Tax=Xanthobacter cornucopiae TaxID=3119924 RepID=UPI003726672E